MNTRLVFIYILWLLGSGFNFSTMSYAHQVSDETVMLRPVEEFVRQGFADSLPFEKIKQYSAIPELRNETVDKLIKMLNDCTPFCSNVLAMLGIIGGNDSREAIIRFLRNDIESLPVKTETDAIMILGYWINSAEKNAKDMESHNGFEGKATSNRGATNIGNCLVSEIQFGKSECSSPGESGSLTQPIRKRAAILGLGLTGSKKLQLDVIESGKKVGKTTVKEYLEGLLRKTEVGTSFRALIIEALEAHNRIAALGLACYYEKESKECQKNIMRFTGQKNKK